MFKFIGKMFTLYFLFKTMRGIRAVVKATNPSEIVKTIISKEVEKFLKKDSSVGRLLPEAAGHTAIFSTKAEVDHALEEMQRVVDKHGAVTVADLMALLGAPSKYLDSMRGWTDLTTVTKHVTRDGWYLKLPRPLSID